jgi:hypothetical protein
MFYQTRTIRVKRRRIRTNHTIPRRVIMAKSTVFAASSPMRSSSAKPGNGAARKSRWNVLGMRQQTRRDSAALAFARLGLLATRW